MTNNYGVKTLCQPHAIEVDLKFARGNKKTVGKTLNNTHERLFLGFLKRNCFIFPNKIFKNFITAIDCSRLGFNAFIAS